MSNLVVRTLSGIAFIIIITGAMLGGPLPFAIVFGLILAQMMNEYLTISMGPASGNKIGKILGITAGVFFFIALFLITGYQYDASLLLLPVLPLIGIFIGNLYIKKYNVHEVAGNTPDAGQKSNGYEAFPFIFSAFIYIALPVSLFSLVVFDAASVYSGKILLSMLILLWCSDVGAYCFGSTLGQKFGHKLFFSISPKKSWEGFFGGLISSIIGGIILFYSELLPIKLLPSIILSVIICVFGTLGDLVESQLKRNFGVKDSGKIMPGHGGMLDRFDGALIAFPVAIVYLMLFIL